jgi:uncharacterized protein YdeI (YjbR/CyaY-like superfamily)
MKRIDDDKHKIRFTPRMSTNWSEKNLRHVKVLMKEDKMTPHGLRWLEGIDLSKISMKAPKKRPIVVPDWLEEGIRSNPVAWDTFRELAPSQKRHYVGWITSAKREETRQRRLKSAIGYLAEGKKLPMM